MTTRVIGSLLETGAHHVECLLDLVGFAVRIGQRGKPLLWFLAEPLLEFFDLALVGHRV